MTVDRGNYLHPQCTSFKALWSLLDGIWGVLKGSGGGVHCVVFLGPSINPKPAKEIRLTMKHLQSRGPHFRSL